MTGRKGGMLRDGRGFMAVVLVSGVMAACEGGRIEPAGVAVNTPTHPASEVAAAKQCLSQSPLLAYGADHRPRARDPIPKPATQGVSQRGGGSCTDNTQFRFGAGKADITGPAAGKIHMGNENPDNYSIGVHLRQFARSFVIGSPCSNTRVAMVLTDTGMVFESVMQAVLDGIADDPELAPHYRRDNLMVSATHTHSGPGGYAHHLAYNLFRLGYDEQAFNVIVDGIKASLRQAHRHYEAAPITGPIALVQDELLGASVSRAPEVYRANPEAERARYRDIDGGELDANRLMTLLRLRRDDGTDVGSINWFAVHPTSDNVLGQFAEPISSDNKGYAMFLWERLMATADGEPFVSSFQQADEGDVFSYLWHRDLDIRAERYPALVEAAHKDEPHPLTVANGTAQLVKAMALYERPGQNLRGGVDVRFGFVRMNNAEVTDPVVLDSLAHPVELDEAEKRTCNPSLGYSFLAGGRGAAPGELGKRTRMGMTCANSGDILGTLQRDVEAALAGSLPLESVAYAVGCNAQVLTPLNLACQAEKPVLIAFDPPVDVPLNTSAMILPFQLFRIGNLAIIGLPWEVTTMAGRRIRETVLGVLREVGVDYAVINGLSNDYVNYLTTREEYAIQGYEGASNQFGPWSLAVVQQELRAMAVSMRDGTVHPRGPEPERTAPQLIQVAPLNVVDIPPPGADFGDLVQDADSVYAAGETVVAIFHTADPNNDLMTDSSFLWVERKTADNGWEVVATDRDPETTFYWRSTSPQPQFVPTLTATAEIIWRIPGNVAPGVYRLRHTGVAHPLGLLEAQPFEGVSRAFTVTSDGAGCP